MKLEQKVENQQQQQIIEGAVLDVDYVGRGDRALIRLVVKGIDGKCHEIIDEDYLPYFYLVVSDKKQSESTESIERMLKSAYSEGQDKIIRIEKVEKDLFGKKTQALKITAGSPISIPRIAAGAEKYGITYEYDIPFAKRYTLDKEIPQLSMCKIKTELSTNGKDFVIKSLEKGDMNALSTDFFNIMCFDIEVYNPIAIPRAEKDPVIMISYYCSGKIGNKKGVLTFKKIDLDFVETVKDERALLQRFAEIVKELEIDIITGYNSANFDIRYLIERSEAIKLDFNLSRFSGQTKIERHGLVDRVKIGGIVHVDMYLVAKFVALVGASERILKLSRYRLIDVYEAVSNEKKIMVEKTGIYKMWDGNKEDLEELATYNLNDAQALYKVYETFIPITFELSRITGDMLTDVAVSTTGQLVEFSLMKYAVEFNEIIPNKPDEREMRERLMNPIEGAYVKTPEPGIYDNIVVFDFRGLYPSIIVSYNIDPSNLCKECKEYYESPDGIKFDKNRKGIVPTILRILIAQRAEVKKEYKKDPDNIFLGARSTALKIVSNSVYGYLGYARSRWYSRDCAGSVTSFGRQHINAAIREAEGYGFRVIYGDTDSLLILMDKKSKEEAISFMKKLNAELPGSMELELEDFYSRGVFVGKKTEKESRGAKKKYALIAENGRIKIRGFELVRRDWSKIARDTQFRVLETILKEGSPEKAAEIVRSTIKKLKSGSVSLSELVISTQLRKKIDSYDIKSPELYAAKHAVTVGFKKKEDLEGAVIGYIITKQGSSISERAQLEGIAKDYDPDYYINHQLLPAVMRILKELDYNEDQLKNDGKQKKLGGG